MRTILLMLFWLSLIPLVLCVDLVRWAIFRSKPVLHWAGIDLYSVPSPQGMCEKSALRSDEETNSHIFSPEPLEKLGGQVARLGKITRHDTSINKMNALTRWDPFKDMEDMHNRLAKFFGPATARATGGQELMTVAEWTPSVDFSEDDKKWIVKIDLPEVKKEDVKIIVENNVLTISGASVRKGRKG